MHALELWQITKPISALDEAPYECEFFYSKRKLLEGVRSEEDEELLRASKPLREFLAKFVMPTLTKGIFECIWRRPEDPVDYLVSLLTRGHSASFQQLVGDES